MKLKKLRQLMAEKGFDGLLISSPINQSYISGADFHDGFLAVTSDECAACVDFRYYEAVKGSVSEGIDTKLAESSTLNCALDLLTASGAKSIAFEGGVSYSVYRTISEKLSPTVTLSAEAGGLLNAMRAVKTEAELEKIAEAQKITDLAFSHVLSFMTPNMTERELALELEYFMRKNGADAMAFDVIAVSGGASALPHGVPRDVRLERGFLTMDFGAQKAGYCSDMTRTVVIGKADAEMKRLYKRQTENMVSFCTVSPIIFFMILWIVRSVKTIHIWAYGTRYRLRDLLHFLRLSHKSCVILLLTDLKKKAIKSGYHLN